jgi:UDP-N-acetylglucosamine--dolichyl-phosphate N-acetylglucosaminephosphotransferase
MMDTFLLIAFAASFLLVLVMLPKWIRRAKAHSFVGKDMHKPGKPEVAELGGLVVVPGAVIGVLLFVALQVLAQDNDSLALPLLAAACSILLAGFIGFADDILGWKIGLKQSHKILLSALIAAPVIVTNAGVPVMHLPLLGKVSFGLWYPLLVVPIAIVGASNAFNMLAGYNGLEAGMGIIALVALGLLSWLNDQYSAVVIAGCLAAALLAFLLFNKYPAKVFPGNALTYATGAAIAILAIYGNIEKYALIVFLPYLAEFALKARGRFKKESFAPVRNDCTLEPPAKAYSLPHLALRLLHRMGRRTTERAVVRTILLAELLCAALAFLIFFT